jgi:hypothetical protein
MSRRMSVTLCLQLQPKLLTSSTAQVDRQDKNEVVLIGRRQFRAVAIEGFQQEHTGDFPTECGATANHSEAWVVARECMYDVRCQ